MKNQKKGFTLIELLVVIAIIGLLASIVLVSLGPARNKAKDARRQSDLRQIMTAMELYYDSHSYSYQDTSEGANTLTSITSYLDVVPVDPVNASPYQYTWTNGTSAYYCVYAKAESVVDTWYCSSNKGSRTKTQATYTPSNTDCCGVNVTN